MLEFMAKPFIKSLTRQLASSFGKFSRGQTLHGSAYWVAQMPLLQLIDRVDFNSVAVFGSYRRYRMRWIPIREKNSKPDRKAPCEGFGKRTSVKSLDKPLTPRLTKLVQNFLSGRASPSFNTLPNCQT
ncbi:hypothetical protein QAD02_005899 [Eretmocerus hayati]|uniref:Uncharacterized protein n=1 Tax=Eretmocerus hayati TaxID=131215 RepID=A0ACC2MZX0_9HYME|nr:hypothetical protein QAD02_005899 [Eretmocerus hayati]